MSKKIVCSLLVMVFWLGNALAQNISMRVQLPFVDGERFECTQNSDDAPTHGRNDKYEVVDALATKFDLDFNLSGGTIVTAAADGKVSHGSDSDGFGNYIKIDHGNGYFSLYAHLMNNGYIAKEGNVVVAGQPIGFSGNSGKSTGPHLHFGVHKGSGVGTSVPMEVKAVEYGSDLKYITEKYFKTGYEEQREMYCQNELGLKNAGNIYEAVPSIGIFNQFQCNMLDNNQGVLCWQGDNGNFAFCEDGYHHVRYYPYNGGFRSENIKLTGENMLEMCYPANSKRVNLYAYLYDSTGVGGGGVIEEDLPNLQIRKVEVHDSNGNLLTEEKSYLQVGDQIEIRVWPVSREADAINGMEPGKDNIETDTFYKIAMDESLGNWKFLGRNYTRPSTLTQDNSHMEFLHYTIPPEAAGKRLYIKSKVDSTGEVKETNEHDNWSDYEWYPIEGSCDLTISYARLTNNRTTLKESEKYGFETEVKNIGATFCPQDNRAGYYHKKPDAADWSYVTDDGTDASELCPGCSKMEYTTKEPFTADTPGTHQIMVCANMDNANHETDTTNNCTTSSFEVSMYRSDFSIKQVGLTNGRTQLNLGDKFGLQLVVQNMGNAPSIQGIRSNYQVKTPNSTTWQQWADDGTDASELCVNCSKTEYTTNEPFMANVVGVWQVMGCADYQGAVTETDETNNCTTASFTVNAVGPDFKVTDIYIKVGNTIYREGGTIKKNSTVHPYCVVTNIGNSGVHSANRLAYYINWDKYRDSDGIDANELCVGCSKTEYVSNDNIRLGDTGTRTYRCCADYKNEVAELDESNNCATMTFYVR